MKIIIIIITVQRLLALSFGRKWKIIIIILGFSFNTSYHWAITEI